MQQLTSAVGKLEQTVGGIIAVTPAYKTEGPKDPEAEAHLLRDKASRRQAIQDYGKDWLLEIKPLFTDEAREDDDFWDA